MKPKMNMKLNMNTSLLLLGLVLLVFGNLYYTQRQFNELNNKINNLDKNNNLENKLDNKLPPKLNKGGILSSVIKSQIMKKKNNKEEFSKDNVKNVFVPMGGSDITINPLNEKISENIEKEIKIVENENENENNNESNLNEEIELNLDELDNDIEFNINTENNDNVNILNDKSKKDLMEIAENNNLSKSGTKTDLINRIVDSGIEVN